jgi:CIC family chloride channel protein
VLFVIEELLHDLSSITLGTAIIASFMGAVVSRHLAGHGLLSVSVFKGHGLPIGTVELPLLLLLGAITGLLGALFCQGILFSRSLYDRFVRVGLPWRVALAGGLSGLIIVLLPTEFRNNAGLQEYLVTGQVTGAMVFLVLVTKFFLALMATGSGASGGLFAPSLVLGSSLGYLVPLCALGVQHLPQFPPDWVIPITSPNTYALIGMGSFFSAVAKTPMTAIVIIFEMTGDFNLVLPLMVTSMIAYNISNKIFQGSLYDRLMESLGFQVHSTQQNIASWEQLTASTVMQRSVQTLHPHLTLTETLPIFLKSPHRGFPVVADGELVGILSQSDLSRYSQKREGQRSVESMMTRSPITVQPQDTLKHVLHLLNLHDIGRLPVVEGRRLVGIITLSDIIRAEAQHLEERDGDIATGSPSYVVYQTHGPETGRGRLLVPLSNPKTAPTLLQLAAAIARDRDYELECLQVIPIPKSQSPYTTKVDIRRSRKLLHKAQELGEDWGISVHTQIRITHSLAAAILETIRERRIDAMFMGWKGSSTTPEHIFGDAMDTLIRRAPCTVILVKLAERLQQNPTHYPSLLARLHFNRWLVPVGGGPNTQEALNLLPALVSISSTPEIKLCQIVQPHQTQGDPHQPVLGVLARRLQQKLKCPIDTVRLVNPSIAEAIVELSVGDPVESQGSQERCDVIVIGANRDHFLTQITQGNLRSSVPEAVIQRSQCTVILIRTP